MKMFPLSWHASFSSGRLQLLPFHPLSCHVSLTERCLGILLLPLTSFPQLGVLCNYNNGICGGAPTSSPGEVQSGGHDGSLKCMLFIIQVNNIKNSLLCKQARRVFFKEGKSNSGGDG